MNLMTVGFVTVMTAQMVVWLAADRDTYRPGNLRASLGRFRRSPLVRRAVWQQLRDDNRRGFHPDDRDTTALVDQRRAELFGDRGALNDRLFGTATTA